ncbi:MAG TPA: ZIP family metal transporter [Alkalispirochaeta sp.]|nr:ZIP family metal transporter [Alkalispirochaeta sp.]
METLDLPPVLTVFMYAMITALATGLGAIPFMIKKDLSRRVLGLAGAFAAGIMASASFNLIYEGLNYSLWRTIAGILIGVVLIYITQTRLDHDESLSVGALEGADAKKALMIVGVMTLHSFAEGVGVGVSFGGGQQFGAFISLAIAVHNIPEGLAISLVLVPRGIKVWKAGLWSIFSSLPQPLVAVPAFLFVQAFQPFLPVGLGLAAGAMIWMLTSELIPDALEDAKKEHVATVVTVAIAGMTAFQVLVG